MSGRAGRGAANQGTLSGPGPLDVLARIRANRPGPAAGPAPDGERCEMCGVPLADRHGHVVHVGSRALLCACRPCYLLFDSPAPALTYRAVPDRVLAFGPDALSPSHWDALQIPVGVAFFFHHSGLGRTVAFYPGPAGAAESELPLGAWADAVGAYPALGGARADVEAILVRAAAGSVEAYLVPVDRCYQLVGQLRAVWRGFDGGSDARARLDDFFADLADRAKPA